VTVLVLRALGIGDLATAVPALRGIRTAWPNHRLQLAAPAWLAPLVPLIGAVDELAVTSELRHPPLVSRPDVAVNLHGRGPQSHRLLWRLRPKRTLGFNIPSGPIWYQDEHEITRWCRMLRWYGIDCDETDLALRRPSIPSPVPGATVLHIGAKARSRRWNRFPELASALTDLGYDVVVTGSDSERPPTFPGCARNLVGRLNLEELAALIADARLVVSGDTGVSHLATAYARPSVVLFGPVSPRLWGPPPLPRHQVLWDPYTRRVDAIGVEQVLDAAYLSESRSSAFQNSR
jgi:ADP-heptose:LPS heptosyltransferase